MSAIRVVNLLGMKSGLQTLLFSYGPDLPGVGGARAGIWLSSVLSAAFVVFAGSTSMFGRWIVGKGDPLGSFGRDPEIE